MNTTLMFSTGVDETGTDPKFFAALDAEFGGFVIDLAANASNRKVENYFGPDHPAVSRRDCLALDWPTHGPCWLNPPYSEPELPCRRRRCKKKRCPLRGFHLEAYRPGCIDFVRKAAEQRLRGVTTVALLAARTDNEWFHTFCWSAEHHSWREGIEGRFLAGRLKFEGHANSAPFPSMLVIFRGVR